MTKYMTSVWLDGARPTPKYIFKNNMSLADSKIWPTQAPQKCVLSIVYIGVFAAVENAAIALADKASAALATIVKTLM
jgi:hypothetical protein